MFKINRFFLVVFILFFVNITIYSQKRASIGLSFDAGVSTYFFVYDININDDIIKNSFIQTYGGGLVFTYIDKLMGVQLGLKYIPKGWTETFKNGATSKFEVNYLEMPILTHMRFWRKRKTGLILNFGLFVAKAIDTKISIQDTPNPKQDTLYINYDKPEYTNYEYGLKGGVGYEVEIGRSSLQFQVMFTQGMQDFFEPDRLKLYKSLSQTITASLIYKFSFYRKVTEAED